MLKQFGISIEDVDGTGRAGLVTKEDVQRYQSTRNNSTQDETNQALEADSKDSVSELTSIQRLMFQTMTRSLTIPHFLFTDVVDVTELDSLRRRFNATLASKDGFRKLSLLPFIIKALSKAFMEHKTLNAHLDTQSKPDRPRLLIRGSHNFGIAIDTPTGLLVPVVCNVQNHSIMSLASEIDRLSFLARTGKLQPQDFKDATFTVSNMGSIGGNAVAPVIVNPMVGIVGIGRAQGVPAFQKDASGNEVIVKRTQLTLSWSGDHRVLDGATVAKCARATALLLEDAASLLVGLK
jgi:2-oxoisovalerate dehydrogenase E2 component (dihydrolipoyl transacylase)